MSRARLITRNRPVSVSKRADGGRVISGYAAVFYDPANPGTEYQLWDNVYERIAPTAFNRAIAEAQDVVGCFNHDDGVLLGRTSNATLRLQVDAVGLRYEIDVNEADPEAVSVAAKIERGDLRGSSFAFIATSSTFTETESLVIREIVDCDLYDVCPVTVPAYEATSAAIRSDSDRAAIEREIEKLREKRDAKQDEALKVRLRQLELDGDKYRVA
jgi:HK97 family phage prohead protease